jgi:hypothetical protein
MEKTVVTIIVLNIALNFMLLGVIAKMNKDRKREMQIKQDFSKPLRFDRRG